MRSDQQTKSANPALARGRTNSSGPWNVAQCFKHQPFRSEAIASSIPVDKSPFFHRVGCAGRRQLRQDHQRPRHPWWRSLPQPQAFPVQLSAATELAPLAHLWMSSKPSWDKDNGCSAGALQTEILQLGPDTGLDRSLTVCYFQFSQ